MPFEMLVIARAPNRADHGDPRPPNRLVPPTTAAVIASSRSVPIPDDCAETPRRREAAKIPPKAANAPQTMKAVIRILSTLIPARATALGFAPVA
jgi:hypothetical protein